MCVIMDLAARKSRRPTIPIKQQKCARKMGFQAGGMLEVLHNVVLSNASFPTQHLPPWSRSSNRYQPGGSEGHILTTFTVSSRWKQKSRREKKSFTSFFTTQWSNNEALRSVSRLEKPPLLGCYKHITHEHILKAIIFYWISSTGFF